MTAILGLDAEKFTQALADDDDVSGYVSDIEDLSLDDFGETTPAAVADLVERAFDRWGCLTQPDGGDWQVVAYPLESEYDNSVVVAVRPRAADVMAQLCSLSVDANRLADGQYDRCGVALLVEVLTSVLDEANRVLQEAPALLERVGR